MKIYKSHLKKLVNNYLFEQIESDDQNEEKSKNIEKEIKDFKGFLFDSDDYKFTIVGKDGGLRLTILRKGDGFEESSGVSVEDMILASNGEQNSNHKAFSALLASIMAGYLEKPVDSNEVTRLRSFFASTVGDVIKATETSRIPIANYNKNFKLDKIFT